MMIPLIILSKKVMIPYMNAASSVLVPTKLAAMLRLFTIVKELPIPVFIEWKIYGFGTVGILAPFP